MRMIWNSFFSHDDDHDSEEDDDYDDVDDDDEDDDDDGDDVDDDDDDDDDANVERAWLRTFAWQIWSGPEYLRNPDQFCTKSGSRELFVV